MALKREFLKAMGLDDEKISAIINAHAETVDGLKAKINELETAIEPLKEVAKERDSLKEQLAKAGDSDKVRAEFEAYKQQVENEKQEAKVTEEVTAICKEAGIARESFLRLVSKDFDRSQIQRDKTGAITNRADLVAAVKTNYADYCATTTTEGTPAATPPAGASGGSGGTMTRADIYKKDANGRYVYSHAERQKMIAENLEAFGK